MHIILCIVDFYNCSDSGIAAELGRRLRRERLNRNITQAQLADRAGIGRRTLQNAERGEGTALPTLIAILRALDLLHRLDALLPEPEASPVELAKLHGDRRQRASGSPPGDAPAPEPWTWGE